MADMLHPLVKAIVPIVLIVISVHTLFCQNTDSLFLASPKDSSHLTKDTVVTNWEGVDLKTPKKALIRSAILPGLGQAYNHQYWKIPIVYAGFGALIYAGEFNRKNYRLLKEVYRNMIDGVPTDYDRYSRQSVRLARDNYRKNMELSYIAVAGVYGLNILDAFVSAHLKTFDINENISMKIKPAVQHEYIGLYAVPTGGLTFSFVLH